MLASYIHITQENTINNKIKYKQIQSIEKTNRSILLTKNNAKSF